MVAARTAPSVSINKMQAIDLIVCGSVAVNERGARLGKGAGYSDIEMALLTEAGVLPSGPLSPPRSMTCKCWTRTYPSRRMISAST